jgi:hypothetical protein
LVVIIVKIIRSVDEAVTNVTGESLQKLDVVSLIEIYTIPLLPTFTLKARRFPGGLSVSHDAGN